MKAPRCYVCHLDLHTAPPGPWHEQFVLVRFADAYTPPGRVGASYGMVWFCIKHAHLGQERSSLAESAALAEIDAALGR